MIKLSITTLAAAALLTVALPAAGEQTTRCNDNITASAPDSRYTDNGDGTVTDNTTGLMWKMCSEGQTWSNTGGNACSGIGGTYSWSLALQHTVTANVAAFANYTDWRVPNRKELRSLVEVKCFTPAINATLFPGTPTDTPFWSSSPYAWLTGYAWDVSFDDGKGNDEPQSVSRHLRLVRTVVNFVYIPITLP